MKQTAAADFAFIEAMMALQVRELPVGDWIYEMKFDGYRALAFKMDKKLLTLAGDHFGSADCTYANIAGLELRRKKDATLLRLIG